MTSRLIAAVTMSLSFVAVTAGVSADAGSLTAATGSTAPTTDPGAGAPAPTVFENPFLPEEANVGDCVSALPRPDCGSEERGGWHQALVFVVLAVAVLGIGLRLVVALRKRPGPAG